MVVVSEIEPLLDPYFHEDSFGYRPHRSAHDAITKAERRCWKYAWVFDMNLSKILDTIDHGLLMRAVERHIKTRWILLYIKRWLDVLYQKSNINNVVRGWINYYEKFSKTEFWTVMYCLNRSIAYWVKRKYKRFRRRGVIAARYWLACIAQKEPNLFYHWQAGYVPYVRQKK